MPPTLSPVLPVTAPAAPLRHITPNLFGISFGLAGLAQAGDRLGYLATRTLVALARRSLLSGQLDRLVNMPGS
jgi:hypothetical protein